MKISNINHPAKYLITERARIFVSGAFLIKLVEAQYGSSMVVRSKGSENESQYAKQY